MFSAGAAASALIVVAAAQQSDRARTEALASRASERLQALQHEADRLAAEERTVLSDLQHLEIERQLKAEELKRVDADVAKVTADLDALNTRVESLQSAEASARPELRARLVELYKLGEARYVRVLLSTPDLSRIGDATRMVAALAKIDRDRISAHERTLAELASTRNTLEERRRQAEAVRADAAKAQASLARAAAARNALVQDIDQKRDLNAQLSGELQSAEQKLQAALRDVKPSNPEPGTRNPEPATLNPLPLKPFKGEIDWPVAGTVRSRFGRGSARTA